MSIISSMPPVGAIVIFVILALFAISVIMLFSVSARYKLAARAAAKGDSSGAFLGATRDDYAAAYKSFGQDVNTPAIITNSISARMSGALLCERFLNNAVSLFVTLGLFGTFLGLSLSVSSLTKLISFSDATEWLSVLNSVGGGLMSALSGMGVAFYTSLVGAACSVVLTILRAVLSPEGLRAALETELELWLDHRVAPTLKTDKVKDDADLINRMIDGLNAASESMKSALRDSTSSLQRSLDGFDSTVGSFNKGVHDFSEFDYNLRGTVERLDVTVRDLTAALRGRQAKEREP